MARLRFDGLYKQFGDAVVIDGLCLDVADGEFLALLGPSGCGKSTTLRLTAGFISPDRGTIAVDDVVISAPDRVVPPDQRQMSMIFQSYAVWPHKTVFENVAFGLRVRKRSSHEIDSAVGEMLGFVQMDAYANRYPTELSGGQQQRVALARALAIRPEVLLLDEPLSNLDAKLREEMRYEIRRIHDRLGFTTIYVTHDQTEAMVTADRIVVLRDGRVEQIGSPQEIFERPATPFVADFMGRPANLAVRVLDERTVDMGGAMLRISPSQYGKFKADQPVSLSLLPQAMHIADRSVSKGSRTQNAFVGVIRSHIYLGGSHDYRVAIEGTDVSVRAVTPPTQQFGCGQRVCLTIPPEHCWLIASD